MKLQKIMISYFLNIALAYGGQNELVDAVKKDRRKNQSMVSLNVE